MSHHDNTVNQPSLWQAILLPALAGGMGWGIRGQYGHETGAMIAGVLVGATISLLFVRHKSSLTAARVIAMTAIGFSFGGSMTYGQTVGLTHNPEVIGNWSALSWGLLGLFIKGGIWIGLAGGFLGLGLSQRHWHPAEAGLVLVAMIVLQMIGNYALNQPYQPNTVRDGSGQVITEAALPRIYFSEQRQWYPDKSEIKPRREKWGGLLLAWIGLVAYAGLIRRDFVTRNVAIVGFLAGGIGFASGQCIQAFHAWNPEFFRQGWLGGVEPYMNWWNMMETTFGLILGGGLGLGVWLNRGKLDHSQAQQGETDAAYFSAGIDMCLAAAVLCIIGCWNFLSIPQLDFIADRALPIGLLPVLGILGGRLFPYLFALPIVSMPVAGKTLRELSYDNTLVPVLAGWCWLVILPLALLTVAAVYFWHRSRLDENAERFVRWTLVLTTWVYFTLNLAFFRFPWPWKEPTSRTPSAWIFLVCSLVLTVAAVMIRSSPAVDRRS